LSKYFSEINEIEIVKIAIIRIPENTAFFMCFENCSYLFKEYTIFLITDSKEMK
jgi:hypothetical protein